MKTNKEASSLPIKLTITGDDAKRLREWGESIGLSPAFIALNEIRCALDKFRKSKLGGLSTIGIADGFADELMTYADDTGIPARELRELCFRAGLEALRKGELKVTGKKQGLLPIFLPAKTAIRLREIGHAADLESPDNAIADAILTDMVTDFARTPNGAFNWCCDGWVMSEKVKQKRALAALERKWQAEDTAEAQTEVAAL